MTNLLNKAAALLLAAVMVASFAACGAADTGTKTEPQTEAAKEAEPAAEAAAAVDPSIAARVGDVDISVQDISYYYDNLVQQYAYYGIQAPTADADIETMQDEILDSFISEAMLRYQAKQRGCDTLTAEQQAELDQTVESMREEILSYYRSNVNVGDNASEEKINEAAIEIINQELESSGYAADFDGYLNDVRESYASQYAIENLEAAVKAEATVTDDDVKAYYDQHLEADRATMADATQYLTLQEEYEMNGGVMPLTVPEGYARVKVLTVSAPGSLDTQYYTLTGEMSDLEAEYGKIVLNETGDEARLDEIKAAHAEKKAKAEELFDAYIGTAKAKIEEASAKLQAGESFADVFAAYNEDDSYTAYAAFGEKGRLIMPEADDGKWSDVIRSAVKTLKAGEYSEILNEDGSFYIVCLIGEEPAGDRAFEDVKEAVREPALEQRQETVWAESQEKWLEEESLITRYEANYRGIGKN